MSSSAPHKNLGSQFLALICLIYIDLYQNIALAAPQIRISESYISQKLQQPTILAIFKDDEGFLWVGTQHGLFKFDGVKLTEFSSNKKGTQWIPVSDIRGINSDSSGRVIVATFGGGLLFWDNSTSSFQKPSETKLADHLYITELARSADGRIWIGEQAGLYSYTSGVFQGSYPLVGRGPSSSVDDLSALTTDREGNTYVAFGKSLFKITKESNSIERVFFGESHGGILGNISTLTVVQANQIYMGTETGEILSFNTASNTLQSTVTLGINSTISITSLLFHNDILWIGTNNGLSYTDSDLSFIRTLSQENSGLANNHVISLFAEKDYIWIGTYQGLSVLSFVPFDIFNSQNSGVFNDVLAFEEDAENDLWVGTYNGLYFFDTENEYHTHYQDLIKSKDTVDPRVMTLASRGDELWIGLQENGVQVLNTRNLQIRGSLIQEIEQLEVTKILHIDEDRTWVATYNQGLYLFEHGRTISYLANGQLPEKSITLVFDLEQGQLLASSEQNIYLFDEASNKFSRLSPNFGDAVAPPLILALSQNENGDVWIGTKDQGLFIWPRLERSSISPEFVQVDTGNTTPLTTVYEVQFDEDGNAWCSTQNGLVKLDSKANLLASFSATAGLQAQDFNFGASFKDSLGRIYFGGSKGYNRFYPRDVHMVDRRPRLSITRVAVSVNSQIDYFTGIDLKQIQLTHKNYLIQFEFSVLDFLDPEKNVYRYILEGFDPDWIENGTRNLATYTSLPPGDYTFRVQGANSAGVWNRVGRSIEVQVLPAPWLTWWAYTGYALFGMFIGWLLKRAYDARAIERRAQEVAIERVEAEERADDEMQEQLEIHDDLVKSVYRHSVYTLNLVSEFIATKGSYLTDSEARASTDSSVRRVSALAMLEDCLYYQGDILLADLNKYTELIISKLIEDSPVGEESITTINEVLSQPLPIEQASALAIALYELIENSVQHAFEDASGANYLHVTLAVKPSGDAETGYLMTVQDNGVGIPPNIDPTSAQTPGLMVVSSMADRLSGTLDFALKNGTLVSISFPAQEYS